MQFHIVVRSNCRFLSEKKNKIRQMLGYLDFCVLQDLFSVR